VRIAAYSLGGVELKNVFTSPYVSMTRCPIKHRDASFYIICLLSPVELLLLFNR